MASGSQAPPESVDVLVAGEEQAKVFHGPRVGTHPAATANYGTETQGVRTQGGKRRRSPSPGMYMSTV